MNNIKYGTILATVGQYTFTQGFKRIAIRNNENTIIALAKTLKDAKALIQNLMA